MNTDNGTGQSYRCVSPPFGTAPCLSSAEQAQPGAVSQTASHRQLRLATRSWQLPPPPRFVICCININTTLPIPPLPAPLTQHSPLSPVSDTFLSNAESIFGTRLEQGYFPRPPVPLSSDGSDEWQCRGAAWRSGRQAGLPGRRGGLTDRPVSLHPERWSSPIRRPTGQAICERGQKTACRSARST